MIGQLPRTLTVDSVEYDIRTDYRVALTIFQAYNDPTIATPQQKAYTCLKCLYTEIPPNREEALKQAEWFLNGGEMVLKKFPAPVIDWEQDEKMLFSAVNKAAGKEIRALEYMHFWTFLSFFSEIGECLYSQVLNIRQKRARGKTLEKWERDFLNQNKELVIIREKITDEEQAQIDEEKRLIDELIG